MYFRSAKKSARDVYLDEPVDTDKDGNSMSLIDIIAEDDDKLNISRSYVSRIEKKALEKLKERYEG